MKFNEDSRVKIPSILHLTRLGYKYISLKESNWNKENNIFTDIFESSISKINKDIEKYDVIRLYKDISELLNYEDLGKAFYERLTQSSGIKLIDFENFENNTFNIVTELPCINGEDEFRPDITLLINGMPLVFIEVKKPNNKDGILAERSRMNVRFQNDKFRKFMNITQITVFSNNMEYDDSSPEPIEGAFYSTPSKHPKFNYFRDEEALNLAKLLKPEDKEIENFILKDNNLSVIKNSPEFITNKNSNTPTNRLSTSLFSKNRLAFLLRYSIAYVNVNKGIQKHIMRYPQIFATKAIEEKLDEGIKKGIIWHTQGSGKTALAYYNVKYLTDYYQKKGIIPKFYFIVDRLDLAQQAHEEFSSRGVIVKRISSKDEFAMEIKRTTAIHNEQGKPEITVVNIHKFKDDPDVIKKVDYDVNIQRIFFLDEVHRSYNPKGSFLANLEQSDRDSIKIGLTGTPLLSKEYNSKDLFGNYIHKYYYNASIADGYTLRLIREEIETTYKMKLEEVLQNIKLLQGSIDKKDLYSHERFVKPLLDYILDDFKKSRIMFGDDSVGGMIICDSSPQAKKMFEIFEKNKDKKIKTAALILHDIGSIEERKEKVRDFKDGKIDLLFVYNMLITGFDAPRLKKLYLGRVIKAHNLLQALTRVNRTYKKFKYGFVVDFADISKEFDATNKAYFDELQSELGDEMEHYSSLFKSTEEIEAEIENIKSQLFDFDTNNAENFSSQISQVEDIKTVQGIKKVLEDAKNLYNLIRLFGYDEILKKLDFNKLGILYREASNHLQILNQKKALESGDTTGNILNYALEDIIFKFTKISEEEMVLADKLKESLRKTREALSNNFDKKDPEFISLKEELERLFKSKKLNEITQEDMNKNMGSLKKIYDRIRELNRKNNLLRDKYRGDSKFVRVHKRINENKEIDGNLIKIHNSLMGVKQEVDERLINNSHLLENEGIFNKITLKAVIEEFKNKNNINIKPTSTRYLGGLIVNEYINEYHGGMYSGSN